MKNKVLIKLSMPELMVDYDIFIPVNEIIWKIKKMIIKSISDMSSIPLDMNANYLLINKTTSKIYDNNEIVIDTDIRNCTELMIVKKEK